MKISLQEAIEEIKHLYLLAMEDMIVSTIVYLLQNTEQRGPITSTLMGNFQLSNPVVLKHQYKLNFTLNAYVWSFNRLWWPNCGIQLTEVVLDCMPRFEPNRSLGQVLSGPEDAKVCSKRHWSHFSLQLRNLQIRRVLATVPGCSRSLLEKN